MLQYIADVVKKQFGKKDTFRIGGDEYVAFALELSEEEIKARIAEMNAQIQEHGYHAAVGYEYHSGKNADIGSMIMQAESKMYSHPT